MTANTKITFGQLLRDQRHDRDWSQPEAASAIGIEQSYLSKLETGKSFPSNEMFDRLMGTYQIDILRLIDCLQQSELDRMREIDVIRLALSERKDVTVSTARAFLIGGIVALMLGGACLGTAMLSPDQTRTEYAYQSFGTLSPDETDQTFEERPRSDTLRKTFDYKGPSFVETQADGDRVYTLVGGTEVQVAGRFKWLAAPGLMLVLAGLGCFFASWRWPLTQLN